MVLGLASVVTAARQHQTVGMLNSPLDIRLWLSRGRAKSYGRFLKGIVQISQSLWSASYGRHTDRKTDEKVDKYKDVQGFDRLPLESSISALKATTLPRHLLDLAVLVFLVGFGLYVLFLWLSNIQESGEGHRKVFIVFIVTVGTYAIYDFLIELARILDNDKINSEFNTKALGGFGKPEELLALKKELEEVQLRMKSEHPSE